MKELFCALSPKCISINTAGRSVTAEFIAANMAAEIITQRILRGLFIHKTVHDEYIGIDNTTGDAWTEVFTTLDKCLKWLADKQEVVK